MTSNKTTNFTSINCNDSYISLKLFKCAVVIFSFKCISLNNINKLLTTWFLLANFTTAKNTRPKKLSSINFSISLLYVVLSFSSVDLFNDTILIELYSVILKDCYFYFYFIYNNVLFIK